MNSSNDKAKNNKDKQSPIANFQSALVFSSLLFMGAAGLNTAAFAQDSAGTLEPPTLGQDTKGTPAFDESSSATPAASEAVETTQDEQQEASASIFGNATVTESKRESGQVYLIELEHSSGSKQYIEETDSDGKIESTSNDIEETPNLPKWKIGSW